MTTLKIPATKASPPSPPPRATVAPRVLSEESVTAPFETLFNDFDLKAEAVYNFWVEDEETNDKVDRGNCDLADLPRYVRLRWNKAPKITRPDPKSKRESHRPPVSQPGAGVVANGVSFTPGQLQPEHFATAVRSLANAYLAAAVLETVTEIDTRNAEPPAGTPVVDLIDEDAFLSRASLRGIPFEELNSALWNRKSSVFGSQLAVGSRLQGQTKQLKDEFFDGQFGAVRSAGRFSLTAANPSSPAVGIDAASARSLRGSKSRVQELAHEVQPDQETTSAHHAVKVKFVHTNLGGVVNENRVQNIRSAEHAEAVAAIAPVLANLVVGAETGFRKARQKIDIPSFPAPAEFEGIEYIGYVMEKYAWEGASFVLKETIYLPDRDIDEYIDSKIKYGSLYRYRIRSIVRWGRPRSIGVMGEDLTNSEATTRSIFALTPNLVSFFGSEWSPSWAKIEVIDTVPPPPPDELMVLPNSAARSVRIAFKLPYNPQRDICKMVFLRKQIDLGGLELSAGWETIGEVGPENGAIEDGNLQYDRLYIYTGISYSRHGEYSTLGDQLLIRLNEQWRRTGEAKVKFYSGAGVDKDLDSGVFSRYPEVRLRSELIVSPDKTMVLTGQPRLAASAAHDNKYFVRIESLDTGQSVDIPVDVRYNNLPTQTLTEESAVVIAASK